MPKPIVITKSKAVIHTASIRIKTLQINNKQVTLSIFRQLPEEAAFVWDEEAQWLRSRGTVWGAVNYVWDNPKSAHEKYTSYRKKHFMTDFHIVWEIDGKLFRCPIPVEADLEVWGPKWILGYEDGCEVWLSRVLRELSLDQLFIAV